jgi:general secretion pathway protein B
MSFILDALKKSELERQRQTVPGLMDTRSTARRRTLPRWAIALGVLLAINLMVLTYVLMRKSTLVPQAPPSAQSSFRIKPDAPLPAAPASPSSPENFSPMDAAPVYAPEIPVAATAATPGVASPTAADRLGAVDRSAVHPNRQADPVLSNEDAQADSQEVLPSISELSLSGAQALPELHLDVHVYATRATERFVYINMRKYHEGSALQEGPTVERIRRDGVVLNYQGLRFILPRQQ